MVATELTAHPAIAPEASREPSCAALSAAAVIGFTTLGIGLALVDPTLAGATRPHPTLTGSLRDAVAILQNNALALAPPFLLVVLGLPQSRLGRRAGDIILTALTAASTIPVGLELGRWQGRLLPYIPQLPLEWAALAVALGAWLSARANQASRRRIVVLAAGATVLLVGAAAIETWSTPHRHARSASNPTEVGLFVNPTSLRGSVVAIATDCAPAPALSLQGRQLPSPHHVRFRSAVMPALTGLTSTTDPPKEGSPDEQRVCFLELLRGHAHRGVWAADHVRWDG